MLPLVIGQYVFIIFDDSGTSSKQTESDETLQSRYMQKCSSHWPGNTDTITPNQQFAILTIDVSFKS